jgi:hypothetical protein
MDNTFIRRVPRSTTTSESRPVRTERWSARTFYAFPCAFLLDVPVDMTGCIQGALRAATRAGLRPRTDGDVLATDAIQRGAVLVEIEDDPAAATFVDVVRFRGGELLVRDLPPKVGRLRVEVDELLRWAREIGGDVASVYVRYDAPAGGAARAIAVFAALHEELEGAPGDVERAG